MFLLKDRPTTKEITFTISNITAENEGFLQVDVVKPTNIVLSAINACKMFNVITIPQKDTKEFHRVFSKHGKLCAEILFELDEQKMVKVTIIYNHNNDNDGILSVINFIMGYYSEDTKRAKNMIKNYSHYCTLRDKTGFEKTFTTKDSVMVKISRDVDIGVIENIDIPGISIVPALNVEYYGAKETEPSHPTGVYIHNELTCERIAWVSISQIDNSGTTDYYLEALIIDNNHTDLLFTLIDYIKSI